MDPLVAPIGYEAPRSEYGRIWAHRGWPLTALGWIVGRAPIELDLDLIRPERDVH